MRIVLAFLLPGLALAHGDNPPAFIFTPGHEYDYKTEYKAKWRDAGEQDLPNWIGEMKVWPIEKRADGPHGRPRAHRDESRLAGNHPHAG